MIGRLRRRGAASLAFRARRDRSRRLRFTASPGSCRNRDVIFRQREVVCRRCGLVARLAVLASRGRLAFTGCRHGASSAAGCESRHHALWRRVAIHPAPRRSLDVEVNAAANLDQASMVHSPRADCIAYLWRQILNKLRNPDVVRSKMCQEQVKPAALPGSRSSPHPAPR